VQKIFPLAHTVVVQLQVPQLLLQDLEEPPQLHEPSGQLACPQLQDEEVVRVSAISGQHLPVSLELSSEVVT